tara:strand:- start:5486 stop:6727 length:1242 start_codon:yes stop_codon:yes gene_type:complete
MENKTDPKMKVLVFSQYYWPESFRINDIAKTLSEKGIEVEVLTGKPNYPRGQIFEGYRAWGGQQETHEGINIHRIPLFPRGRGGWRLALNYLSFVIFGILFAPWLLRRKKFDAIFVYAPSPIIQTIPAIFLGWLKGCPVVLWVQDLWPESLSATGYVKNTIILNLVEKVVRFIYRHVDMLLVPSEAFIEPVKTLAPSTHVSYLPNSVDESFLKPLTANIPEVAGLGSGFSVLFAGNIGSAQATNVIIQTAELLKEYTDIQFVIMGDGSQREWMLQQKKERKLDNIHFPGRFPIDVMPGLMQQASVLLVTLRDQKIFHYTIPSKIQAYLAAGRPIIACLNGEGARLVREAKAGLAVPAEDVDALTEAILQLYRMPMDEREALGAKGQSYYKQNFAHNMLVEQLIFHFYAVTKLK